MAHTKLAAIAAVLAMSMTTPSWAKTDSAFLTDAIKGDNSEVTLGNLAVQKTSDPAVKKFGQALVDDHTKAKKDAVAVATKVGVPPTQDLTDEAKAELKKLDGLSAQPSTKSSPTTWSTITRRT